MSVAGIHRDLGLTDDEYQGIRERLGREPSYTELAMYSVMWSEHCSYKSSRVHLRNLPTEGKHILVGPGEGAGIVEVAPGKAVAFKIESHNHPSFVEPFNGAATGVGGIVRDILSMGARPIALLDSLRFGHLDDARTRYLVDGVVHGISSYGNSIGVPTVGGEILFEDCYAENPLVNVACLGVIDSKLMHGRAEGPGNQVILIGSSTGRDGIGGASVLASAEFDDESHTKRPSVQVGDPFTEKLLIEACLELIREGLLVGLQDLGAGGVSCPTCEMTAKAGTGMTVRLDAIHLREADMEPFEIMISESQERMMAVVDPTDVSAVLEICAKWGLTASLIGEITKDDRLTVTSGDGSVLADVPPASLADEGPVYERPLKRPSWIDELQAADHGGAAPEDIAAAFTAVLGSPNVVSKRWAWEQYDHMIFLGTVQGPGSDAAVIRLPDSDVAVAVTTDGHGRYCYLDPYEGARLAVAEAARNVACTGAAPLAVTNCLNFGNPEKVDVMWQFAEAVRGIGDACLALGTPVTGGNVSFYNETSGRPIYPTPVIGMLGVLPSPEATTPSAFSASGDAIVLLGRTDPKDLGASEYAKVVNSTVAGKPPALDLDAEAALIGLLVKLNRDRAIRSAHDPSVGGLAVCLAECAIQSGLGFSLSVDLDHAALFSESPSRAVISCDPLSLTQVLSEAEMAGVSAEVFGVVGGTDLDFHGFKVPMESAKRIYDDTLSQTLSATTITS